jgi:hypothetical protein
MRKKAEQEEGSGDNDDELGLAVGPDCLIDRLVPQYPAPPIALLSL